LGARVGYSAATVSRIEQGKQLLRDIVVIRAFTDALGIPPEVMGLADAGLPRQGRAEQELDSLLKRIAQLEVVAAGGAAAPQLGEQHGRHSGSAVSTARAGHAGSMTSSASTAR
jgi:transcriptional regulator with XRE-family HTH domain